MLGWLSFLTLSGGTVLGAIAVARTDPTIGGWASTYQVSNSLLLTGALMMGVGIWLRRRSLAVAVQDRSKAGGSFAITTTAAEEITTKLAGVAEQVGDLSLDKLHAAIDHIVAGPVTALADNRQAIADRFGMKAYAAVMGPFSQGERYLNRAWSAAADGYMDESVEYVKKAVPILMEVKLEMQKLADIQTDKKRR